MTGVLLAWGTLAFVLSFLLSRAMISLAPRLGLMDAPEGGRKIHDRAVPLSGGLAIFAAVSLIIAFLLAASGLLTSGEMTARHFFGVFLGALILQIGGILDDRYELPPKRQILAPALAALAAIGMGIEIDKLTNPMGGVIHLAAWESDILVFLWLMVVMYTTKFLDGVDGLATGVTGIGTLMIMLLALTAAYFQPDVAVLAAVAFGAYLGFFLWNIHPARLFLGEGGSTLVGYFLGVLAVISGGKLATALLVIGIPLMDVVWVVFRRFREGGLRRVFTGDRKHLHHRLLDIGWGQRRVMAFYLVVAVSFGGAALFLQSRDKLIALIILSLLMGAAAMFLTTREKRV